MLRHVFTGLLPSNGRPSIVGCDLVGTCLPICFLETAQSVTLCCYEATLVILKGSDDGV
jgi:hypothetical protein